MFGLLGQPSSGSPRCVEAASEPESLAGARRSEAGFRPEGPQKAVARSRLLASSDDDGSLEPGNQGAFQKPNA